MRKSIKKQNDTKFDEFIMRVNVERLDYLNLLQDFKFRKSVGKIAIDIQ